MGRETSQFNVPDRQLLATNTQSRADVLTDIGEARIVHTIFGKAKVRVIRKQDQVRRAWLLTALAIAVTALAAAAWQGLLPQPEPLQSAALSTPASAKVQVTAPVFQAEQMAPPAPLSTEGKAGMPLPVVGRDHLTASQKNAAQPQPDLNAAGKTIAQPATVKPLLPGKPQAVPLAANNNAPKHQAAAQQPAKLSPQAPIVAAPPAAPAATPVAQPPAVPAVSPPPIVSPMANKPVVVAPDPVIKKNIPALPPVDSIQLPGSINEQP